MGKTIKLKYEGTDYVLGYSRKTIEGMERRGFNINEYSDKPVTMLPQLFQGAFLLNHKYMKVEVIDKIFNSLDNKMELSEKLIVMYTDALETLFEKTEGAEGNAQWETDW